MRRLRGAALPLLALALLVALVFLGRSAGPSAWRLAARLPDTGAWGPFLFIAAYVAATLAFVPGSILTLAAGALFGLGRGVLYVFIAAFLGSSGAFVIARHLARPAIARRLAAEPRFAAIDRAIGRSGLRIAFLLRLSPVVPFNLLNYLLGATRIRFVDASIAAVGMLPGTFLYVYYGKVAGDVAALAAGAAAPRGAGYWTILALGLAATFAAAALLAGLARRALQAETGGEDDGATTG